MFEGINYVYAVYREQSFSKAAAAMYISQPSLSIMVKKEEERLGFPIFDRSSVPIRLTEMGREYMKAAEKLFEIKSGFERYLSEVNEVLTGTLYIGSTNLFVSYALPPLLQEYSRLYPGVHIRLLEAASGELMEGLRSGELDLMLDNQQTDPEVFGAQRLCSEHLLLAVPKNIAEKYAPYIKCFTSAEIRADAHLACDAECVSPECFRDAPFLFQKPGNDTRERESAICRRYRFEPKPRFELDQQSTAYNLSCAGLGISFVGDLLVKWDPRDELRFFMLEGSEAVRSINFYYKKSRYLSGAVREFLKLAEKISLTNTAE